MERLSGSPCRSISPVLLRRGRKYAFIALLIVAAFITPTGDPLSMLLLAAPLYLLYELSITLCSSQKTR